MGYGFCVKDRDLRLRVMGLDLGLRVKGYGYIHLIPLVSFCNYPSGR